MKTFYIFVILSLLLISGCNFALGTPSDASIQTAIVKTMASAPSNTPTNIPPIILESTASPSPSLTATFKLLPSSTPETFIPETVQIDASIYALSNLANNQLLVTIQFPGNVEGNFRATVNDLDYRCKVINQYPDRLYCNGTSPGSGKYALLRLYREGDDQPIFEEQIGTPVLPPSPASSTEKPKAEVSGTPLPTVAPPTIPPYPYP